MKLPDEGCIICGSTWGDYWREIAGQRMFFCCEICAVEFQNMLDEVRRRTGWEKIDEIKVEGDQRGRTCVAASGGKTFGFFIRFNSEGEILTFSEESP